VDAVPRSVVGNKGIVLWLGVDAFVRRGTTVVAVTWVAHLA